MTQDTEQEVKQFTAWWANDMNNADSPRAKVAKATAWLAWQAARATPPEGSAGDVRALREALVIARGWMLDHEYAGVDSLLIGVMHAGDLAIVDRALAATEDRAPAEGDGL